MATALTSTPTKTLLEQKQRKKHNLEKIPKKKIHFREDGDHKTQTTKMLKRHNRPQPQCPKHVKATARMKLNDKLQKVRKFADNSTLRVSVSQSVCRQVISKPSLQSLLAGRNQKSLYSHLLVNRFGFNGIKNNMRAVPLVLATSQLLHLPSSQLQN